MGRPRKFKGRICRGGHLAITYGGQVTVPPDIFAAELTKATLFRVCCFSHMDLLSRTNVGYHAVNTIIFADRTKTKGTITHPPCMTIQMTGMPIALYSSQKETGSPFKFLGTDQLFVNLRGYCTSYPKSSKISIFCALSQNYQHFFEKQYMHLIVNCPRNSKIVSKLR